MKYLNNDEKNKIKEQLNPKGSNFKDCNFFKVLEERDDSYLVEVGYWITYLGCRPIYKKENVVLMKEEDVEENIGIGSFDGGEFYK